MKTHIKDFIKDFYTHSKKTRISKDQFKTYLKLRLNDINHIPFVGDDVDIELIKTYYMIETGDQLRLSDLAKERVDFHFNKAYGEDYRERLKKRLLTV